MIEKIDSSKIRGQWIETKDNYVAGGDDTIESIKMVAEKINEIIDHLNREEK